MIFIHPDTCDASSTSAGTLLSWLRENVGKVKDVREIIPRRDFMQRYWYTVEEKLSEILPNLNTSYILRLTHYEANGWAAYIFYYHDPMFVTRYHIYEIEDDALAVQFKLTFS